MRRSTQIVLITGLFFLLAAAGFIGLTIAFTQTPDQDPDINGADNPGMIPNIIKKIGNIGGNTSNVDDWAYGGPNEQADGAYSNVMSAARGLAGGGMNKMAASAPMMSESTIGFSVGGAKDINNFRKNIENEFFPIMSDITYEGLFYDYYFDTGATKECEKLFCPSYTYAVSKDPLSKDDDYYMAVGMNSGITESDFKRKKLNLVVVLDVSGSMSSSFDKYYYDNAGKRVMRPGWEEEDERDASNSKMEVATKSIVGLLDHLEADDRFGMVLFDNQAYLAKPLNLVGETDMESIADHILELRPQGGTQMSAGMSMATDLFDEYQDIDANEYENRIIFLTDAMPNIGETSEQGLLGMTKKNADNEIYSTFIGIGVDFNTELIEAITKIRGANYYSVHRSSQFKKRMDEQFEYMVTPLVFDLKLKLVTDGWQILKVYGSPEADEATGEIMKINTLFPSDSEGGQTKGGVVLLKLRKINEGGSLRLGVSYEDRMGTRDSDSQTIYLEDTEPEYFDNLGIRKAVLLARYADLMKNWIQDERLSHFKKMPIRPYIDYERGIMAPIPMPPQPGLGQWERQSVKLSVSSHYQGIFRDFADYFEDEMDAIGDESLDQELEILEKLADHGR